MLIIYRLLVLLAVFCTVNSYAAPCEPRLVDGTVLDSDKKASLELSTDWNDKKILAVLGLNIDDAKVEKSIGIDGSSKTYTFHGTVVRINDVADGRLGLLSSITKHADIIWHLNVCSSASP